MIPWIDRCKIRRFCAVRYGNRCDTRSECARNDTWNNSCESLAIPANAIVSSFFVSLENGLYLKTKAQQSEGELLRAR